MTLATPDAIVTANVFGYIFEDDGITPIQGGTAHFTSEPFQLNGNLVTIDLTATSSATGLYQQEVPVTLEGNVGNPVKVEVKYTNAAGRVLKRLYIIAVDGLTDPIEIDDAVIEKIDNFVIKRGTTGPQGVPGPTGAPGTISKISVVDVDNPTELNSLNVSSGSPLVVVETMGASAADEESIYIFDLDGPALNTPYIMATSDGGTTRWIATGGKYDNSEKNFNGNLFMVATRTVDGRDVSVDGTKLDGVEPLAQVNIALASQAEAEAGVENTKTMTALRTQQNYDNQIKEMWFSPGTDTANQDRYSTRNNSASASSFFTFQIPLSFSAIVALEVVLFPSATDAAADIDLFSSYGSVGENRTVHQESETTNTYALTTNILAVVDITPVFSSIVAGDICGLEWDQNGLAGATRVLGIRMRYR